MDSFGAFFTYFMHFISSESGETGKKILLHIQKFMKMLPFFLNPNQDLLISHANVETKRIERNKQML